MPMNDNDINALWASIQMMGSEKVATELSPLEHLAPCLNAFGLQTMDLPAIDWQVEPDMLAKEASFKESSHAILLSLRRCLYAGKEMETVRNWAEKLMRFCEVRLPGLHKRAIEKCGNPASANLLVLHITAFLADFALASRDLRFLNTALKLTDLNWVINERSIARKLNGCPSDLDSALFQFRVLLSIEYAITELAGEGAL